MLQLKPPPLLQSKLIKKIQNDNDLEVTITSQSLSNSPRLPTHVRYLDLSSNLFVAIPNIIFQLKLFQLMMRQNEIKIIPDEIANLTELQYLDLSRNKISQITPKFSELQALQNLNLNDNLIDAIPDSFGELKLKFIGISRNRFYKIPKSFFKLLPHLSIIDLDWLQYCEQNTLSDYVKNKLYEYDNDISFEEFKKLFNKKRTPLMLDDIIFRQSIGVLEIFMESNRIGFQHLFKVISICKNQKNYRILYHFISLIQKNYDQLNITFLLLIRMHEWKIIPNIIEFPIDFHYISKYDLVYNNKVIIFQGQSAFQIFIQYNEPFNELNLMVQKGFKPQMKINGYNCLHLSVLQKNLTALEWSLKYCDVNSTQQKYKNTALHLVFQMQEGTSIISKLQEYDVNPFIENIHNKIPRYCQSGTVYLTYVKLFLKLEKQYLKKRMLNSEVMQIAQHKIIENHDINQKSKQELFTIYDHPVIILSKIVRQKIKYELIIQNILEYRNNQCKDQQQILLVDLLLILILYRIQYGYKFISNGMGSILMQINSLETYPLSDKQLQKIVKQNFISINQHISQNFEQITTQNQIKTDNVVDFEDQKMSSRLTITLKSILNNTVINEISQINQLQLYRRVYFYQFNQQQINNNQTQNLSIIQNNNKSNNNKSNFLLLDQYEQLQQNNMIYRNAIQADFTTVIGIYIQYLQFQDSPRQSVTAQMKNRQFKKQIYKIDNTTFNDSYIS